LEQNVVGYNTRASIAFALHRGNGRVVQCFASAARVTAIENSIV